MSFFESNDHPNANNSKWLGIATIALFIIGALLPWITGKLNVYNIPAFNFTVIGLGIITWYSAFKVGFKNTFETNEDWKTGVQALSAIANIIVPAIFVASN